MILDQLSCPIVLAPLAGGPSTPALAAAVAEAGGLGFLGSGYLSAADTEKRLHEARQLTPNPLGINVFHPGAGPADPASYEPYVRRLQEWAARAQVELGQPRYSDDDWDAKLELLARQPVEVVSFTFGCPPPEVVRRLQSSGSEVWVTITSVDEARQASEVGADALVVQGAEAGGHRGSFTDRPGLEPTGLLALLQLVADATALPLVASGGIATGAGVAAVLAAGAAAAAVGTAFMLASEAGTAAAHRAALPTDAETTLTRAFTGRLARGIRNEFIATHEPAAVVAYPELHYVTSPMRRQAREQGDPEQINLWAGQAHALAREEPAQDIVRRLANGARDAANAAVERTAPRATAAAPSVFDSHADDYDAARRRLIPPFEDFYGIAVDAVALSGRTPQRILDVGAGTGLLAARLCAAYPAARLTLLDGAASMLAQARARLGAERVDYIEADLGDPLPEGPWDAIVSALAIHHLSHERQRELLARVHDVLLPDGVFVNAEQVAGPTERFDQLYRRWHERSAHAAGSDAAEWRAATERMAYDCCASVEDLLSWLRAAGFAQSDCLFKHHRFAVMVAVR